MKATSSGLPRGSTDIPHSRSLFATTVIARPDIMAGDLIFQGRWDSPFSQQYRSAASAKDLEIKNIWKQSLFLLLHPYSGCHEKHRVPKQANEWCTSH